MQRCKDAIFKFKRLSLMNKAKVLIISVLTYAALRASYNSEIAPSLIFASACVLA